MQTRISLLLLQTTASLFPLFQPPNWNKFLLLLFPRLSRETFFPLPPRPLAGYSCPVPLFTPPSPTLLFTPSSTFRPLRASLPLFAPQKRRRGGNSRHRLPLSQRKGASFSLFHTCAYVPFSKQGRHTHSHTQVASSLHAIEVYGTHCAMLLPPHSCLSIPCTGLFSVYSERITFPS